MGNFPNYPLGQNGQYWPKITLFFQTLLHDKAQMK